MAYSDFSVTQGGNVSAGNQNQNMINIRHVVNGTNATAAPADSLTSLRTDINALESSSNGLYENAIINGDFSINQYALLPITGLTAGTYYVDRWRAWRDIVTANCSLQTTSQPSELPNGQSYRVTASSTSSSGPNIGFYQKVEDKVFDHLQGQEVTFSAWVKSTNTNTRLRVLENGVTNTYSAKISSSGVWERLSLTLTLNSSLTSLELWVEAGVGETITINSGEYVEGTGIKLELGSTSTPYKPRHYGTELALCQRYYQLSPKLFGIWISSNVFRAGGQLPVTMRIDPSIAIKDSNAYHEYWNITGYNGISSLLNNCTKQDYEGNITSSAASGRSYGDPVYISTGAISLNAELT